MKALRYVNLSATVIVLVCFFLPWVQVSCVGAQDTLSGFDLARNEHASLWVIPVLMVALVLLALARSWKAQPRASAVAGLICGGVTAFLMNRERARFGDAAGVISAQLTGWFWLGLFSSLLVALTAVVALFSRPAQTKSNGD